MRCQAVSAAWTRISAPRRQASVVDAEVRSPPSRCARRTRARALPARPPGRSGLAASGALVRRAGRRRCSSRRGRGRSRCAASVARRSATPRVRVVLGEPLDVVLEGVDPGRGEDAGLAHRAAQHARKRRAPRCRLARPGEHRPAGAPSPFESATPTRSNGAASAAASSPRATAAFKSRAPSRYDATSRSRALAAIRSQLRRREDHAARAVVRVLHLDERRRRVEQVAARLDAPRRIVGGEDAAVADSVNCTPAFAAPAPASCQTAWLSRLTITSSPGRVNSFSASWFAMCPDGTKSAASLPSSPATSSCSRLTVGSSPYWSSPTGASAIAARISGDGRVTVSERRSITFVGDPNREAGRLAGAAAAGGHPLAVARRNRPERARAAEDDRDLAAVAQHEPARVAGRAPAVDVDAQLLAAAGAVRTEAARVEADAPLVEELAEPERARLIGLEVDDAARAVRLQLRGRDLGGEVVARRAVADRARVRRRRARARPAVDRLGLADPGGDRDPPPVDDEVEVQVVVPRRLAGQRREAGEGDLAQGECRQAPRRGRLGEIRRGRRRGDERAGVDHAPLEPGAGRRRPWRASAPPRSSRGTARRSLLRARAARPRSAPRWPTPRRGATPSARSSDSSPQPRSAASGAADGLRRRPATANANGQSRESTASKLRVDGVPASVTPAASRAASSVVRNTRLTADSVVADADETSTRPIVSTPRGR